MSIDLRTKNVPDHFHCGFEIVTYMLEGQTHQKDFTVHNGTIWTEDLQAWTKDCAFGDVGQASDLRLWITAVDQLAQAAQYAQVPVPGASRHTDPTRQTPRRRCC